MKIPQKIINIRNKNNLTQENLTEILCISKQTRIKQIKNIKI